MANAPRRTAWIVAPPDVCCLCKEPLGRPAETSSWNGVPAHRECVRVHLLHRDPAFRDGEVSTDSPEESSEGPDEILQRDDEDDESS